MKKGFRMTSSCCSARRCLRRLPCQRRITIAIAARTIVLYDSAHRQYRNWNRDEDQAYRGWYGQTYNGRHYRNCRKLNKKPQQAYWKWRNDHNDHDGDDRH